MARRPFLAAKDGQPQPDLHMEALQLAAMQWDFILHLEREANAAAAKGLIGIALLWWTAFACSIVADDLLLALLFLLSACASAAAARSFKCSALGGPDVW